MMLRAAKKIAFGFALLISTSVLADEMGQVLFKETNQALQEANQAQANILAPTNYAKATEYYTKAKERFDKGKSIESIKKELSAASEYLKKAVAATKIAEVTLADGITARQGAVAAEAKTYAENNWWEAEEKFADAASRLESGNVKRAQKISAQATELYEAAELSAIKNHYLNSARALVEQAKKDKAHKYAPLTLQKAESKLAEAEKALDANRYDLDEPRSLAKEAMYEAGHAIQITKVTKQLDDDDLTTEQLILSMESPITQIGENFNLKPSFDGSVDNPIASIQENIGTLQNDSLELADARKEILDLERAISELELKLGVQSDRLARQEEDRQKLAQVEALFSPSEANVFKKGNSVIIRMVGLNFQSGKSTIDPQYFRLLRTVKSAIEIFPYASFAIEGHTDSFGTDSTNLILSQQRADAVKSYLLANLDSSFVPKIAAQGYGESRPIGNNETEEGRRKNRRIDLIINY